ncbi:hypothetical protein V6N13_149545 [Hibiscus sabdariffa]
MEEEAQEAMWAERDFINEGNREKETSRGQINFSELMWEVPKVEMANGMVDNTADIINGEEKLADQKGGNNVCLVGSDEGSNKQLPEAKKNWADSLNEKLNTGKSWSRLSNGANTSEEELDRDCFAEIEEKKEKRRKKKAQNCMITIVDMRILTWNVRGMGSDVKISVVRGMVRLHRIDLLFIHETIKVDVKEKLVRRVWKDDGFEFRFSAAEGFFRGACWQFGIKTLRF